MPSGLRYPVVLFDLDGTLIDSGRDLVASVRHALEQVGCRLPVDDDDILALVGRPLEDFLPAFGCAADAAAVRRFVDSYREHYARHFCDNTVIFPGVAELLDRLRAAGARLGVVTTKHQHQADFTVQALGLSGWFDCVVGWQEGKRHKPDPEPVLRALAGLEAEPAAALMVGDSELDILAGRNAGCATCAVAWGFRPAWLLREYRPDFLVGVPSAIAEIAAGG